MNIKNIAQDQSVKKKNSCKEKPDLEFLPQLNIIHAVALKCHIKELLRIFLAPSL